MHGAQRIVKYLAVALAFFIMAAIVSAVMFAASTVGFLVGNEVGGREPGDNTEMIWENEVHGEEVWGLEIDIAAVDLKVETGDKFAVRSDSVYIDTYSRGEVLRVEEKSHGWWNFGDDHEVVVTLPRDYDFDKANLTLGAGRVEIAELKTKELSLDVGAGKTEIDKLVVSEKGNINGGAGSLEIKDGSLRNLDFDMGVGKSVVTAELLGKCDLDAGVGRLEVNLLGEKQSYAVAVSKGLGSIRMDGEDVSDDTAYGSGDNRISIDGGVGSIEVRFAEK